MNKRMTFLVLMFFVVFGTAALAQPQAKMQAAAGGLPIPPELLGL